MHQLNTIDSLFLYMDQRGAGMHGCMLQIYAPENSRQDSTERYNRIVSRVEEALPFIPLLHQKVFRVPGNFDKPYWVAQNNIDLNYHIRRISLPSPGDWDQLTEFFSRVCATPMNLDQPLWQVVVVEGLNAVAGLPKNSYAIITKMHHANADGTTGTQVTSVIAGAPISEAAGDGSTADDLIPSFHYIFRNALSSHYRMSLNLGKEYISSIPAVLGWAASRLFKSSAADSASVPDTRFNSSLSPDRVFESVSFNLDEFSDIRRRMGSVTVNDIVMTICSGALRAYLLDKQELPDNPMVAVMPISLREDEVGGNQFGAATVVLHTDIASPIERLRKIHDDAVSSKEAMRMPGGNKIAEIGRLLPEYIIAGLLRRAVAYKLIEKMPPLANCLITNVAGPKQEIRSDGNRLAFMTGAPPIISGLGMEFPVLSYNGNIVVSIISCKKMVPDKSFMASCLRDSFEQLKDEVDTHYPAASKPKRAAGKKPSPRPAKARGQRKRA